MASTIRNSGYGMDASPLFFYVLKIFDGRTKGCKRVRRFVQGVESREGVQFTKERNEVIEN